MLSLKHWRQRISKAWRKKVKRKKHELPETTVRRQDGINVELILWKKTHRWIIYLGGPNHILVEVDQPLSKAALFDWLEKTEPIE